MQPKKYELKDKIQDCGEAFENAKRYHRELREIHRYFMPFRASTEKRAPGTGGGNEGDKLTDYLFDSTGPSAAFAFVANMKADWMPAFDDFFKLENGPLYVADKNELAARAKALQDVTRAAHGLLTKVRLTADAMFSDLFAGTGAMFLSKGNRERDPVRGTAVPTLEIAIENGPHDEAERVFWKRNRKLRHLEELWPNGKFSDRLARLMREKRNDDVEVVQYTYWNPAEERWQLAVWCAQDTSCEIHSETFNVMPWMTPRFFVVPGESFGRGLAHLGLPTAKTLNKAQELALRAAAFALLGLWTSRNDNVFNPATAVMTPGAMWKVAYADGPLKSISRLDIPHNFDISTIVINDQREQLRRVLLDDELPELKDSVRSPTEIAGRMRRYDRNRGGATTRLAIELITPMVQRTVDIMGQHGFLPKDLRVDQILTQATVAAPAAAAMRTDKVERVTSWVQIMTGLFGPQVAALNAKIEDILPGLARDLGIEERYIRSGTEIEQLKQLIDAAVAAALEQQAAAAKGAPAAEQPDPASVAQSFVNGGGYSGAVQ